MEKNKEIGSATYFWGLLGLVISLIIFVMGIYLTIDSAPVIHYGKYDQQCDFCYRSDPTIVRFGREYYACEYDLDEFNLRLEVDQKYDKDFGAIHFSWWGIWGAIGIVVAGFFLLDEQRKQGKKFYQVCAAGGIKSLKEEEALKEAKQIAARLHFANSTINVKRLFYAGEKITKKQKEKAIQSQRNNLEKQKWQDKLREEQLTRYAKYSGRDKRIRMIEVRIAELEIERKEAQNMKSYVNRRFYKKESDWAIHGGIANGIAGPAAGLAVAADVQRRNAEIRAYNQQIAPSVAMVSLSYDRKVSDINNLIKSYEKDKEETKRKQVKKTPPEEVLPLLNFSHISHHIKETGYIEISVDVNVKEDIKLYYGKTGVVDGTIIAQFIQDEKVAGEAKLVLPLMGVQKNQKNCTIESICPTSLDKNKPYTVRFTADNLWIMEE